MLANHPANAAARVIIGDQTIRNRNSIGTEREFGRIARPKYRTGQNRIVDRNAKIGQRLTETPGLFLACRRDIALPFSFANAVGPIARHAAGVGVANREYQAALAECVDQFGARRIVDGQVRNLGAGGGDREDRACDGQCYFGSHASKRCSRNKTQNGTHSILSTGPSVAYPDWSKILDGETALSDNSCSRLKPFVDFRRGGGTASSGRKAMPTLDMHALATLCLTAAALYLFTREHLSLQFSCLMVLLMLVLGFELFPYSRGGEALTTSDFVAGFGNEALITIVLLLILGKGVETSGALRPLGRLLAKIWFFNAQLAMLLTLVVAAFLSAFVNNTPIVVILLPLLIGVAHRTGEVPSRILMPMGFATIVGGMSTTIGTSTNLLVVSVANDLGAANLRMFDFALPAAIAGGIAIIYLWLIAPRILPVRNPPLRRDTPRVFESIVEVTDGSSLADRTLRETLNLLPENIRIERIVRGESLELVRLPTLKLRSGDKLFVRGQAAGIKELQDLFGGGFRDDDLRKLPEQMLVEIVVTQESVLRGKNFSEARDVMLGQLILIGILRPGKRDDYSGAGSLTRPLEVGDVLLMQGERRDIRRLQKRLHLLVLDRTIHVPRSTKAPFAVAIMSCVVMTAAFGWLPILVSALLGTTLMLFTRCLSIDEMASAVDTRLILIIVTSLALATGLTGTGAAEFLAINFVSIVRDLPPPYVLSAVLLLTALLTEIVTNNAIAVIGTPIAIIVARELGVPEIPFVLAVLFGANMSYLTPIGYQTNLLVFSAGGYRFGDFFRVGVPMQIILWITLSIALPVLYL